MVPVAHAIVRVTTIRRGALLVHHPARVKGAGQHRGASTGTLAAAVPGANITPPG